ncbi:MAG: hypothetical protein JWP97_4793 [Labilithrix sp.]|nr:hypothetical protein [Labilithrix sp.]
MKRRAWSALVMVLGVCAMAPTVGDTGGCGRTATELDRDAYANGRKIIDCRRCQDCGITSGRCTRACDPAAEPDIQLPASCRPLYHDGEVCIRALDSASCEAFATYVDEVAPAIPSECDFCRVTAAGAPGDGGTPGERAP